MALEKFKEPLIGILGHLDCSIEFEEPLKAGPFKVYIDLKSAFDEVWVNGVIYKLSKPRFQRNILKWLDNCSEASLNVTSITAVKLFVTISQLAQG